MTKSRLVRSTPFAFTLAASAATVIASVEQNSLASDLNERGEAPILLHRCVRAEGVVQDRDLGLGSGGRPVTAVKTAALASTAKAIVCVVFIVAPCSINSAPHPEQGLGVEAAPDR